MCSTLIWPALEAARSAFCRRSPSPSCSTMAPAIGSIIDVVAVLLIHIERNQVGSITPNRILEKNKNTMKNKLYIKGKVLEHWRKYCRKSSDCFEKVWFNDYFSGAYCFVFFLLGLLWQSTRSMLSSTKENLKNTFDKHVLERQKDIKY